MKNALTIGLLAAALTAGPACAGGDHDHGGDHGHDHGSGAPETKSFYGSKAESRMQQDQGDAAQAEGDSQPGGEAHQHGDGHGHDH